MNSTDSFQAQTFKRGQTQIHPEPWTHKTSTYSMGETITYSLEAKETEDTHIFGWTTLGSD